MEILSHPNKLLIDHLREVAIICKNNIKNKKFNSGTRLFNDLVITDIAYIAGAFHDIGKATSFFQDYIRNPEKETTKLKNHALISSLFAKEIVLKYLNKTQINEVDKKLLSLFIFTTVKRHHGNLQNFSDELIIKNELVENLVIQVNKIDEIEIQKIINELLNGIEIQYQWSDFKKIIQKKEFEDELKDFEIEFFTLGEYDDIKPEKKAFLFYLHQLLYSSLLFADKSDVILSKKIRPSSEKTTENLVEKYRQNKGFNNPEKKIDILKNEAYSSTIENVNKIFSSENHLYSITLPTGLGKTILSFSVAEKIKKLLPDLNLKTIISIPFTSIIDQNFTVYDEILEHPDSQKLLKHHHLAEPEYKINENILDINKSQFLIETWESNVIVTTFVQLLESLFTNDKSKIMKLVNLTNSVIILDEIQSIPYNLWELIRVTFRTLGNKFNSYFILMSATQPLIFEPNKEIIELVPNHKKYFNYFNRTKLINIEKEVSFEKFTGIICDYISENPQKDILIILNTKKTCLECFEKTIANVSEKDADVYYLSTLITPFERKQIIKKIKNNKSKKQKVIISTQLIEAGVDISVDTVFRAFAPLDSIIQAAGRSNRYNEKAKISEVYIYKISELKIPTSRIYGPDLILKTKNVFNGITEINETEYLSLIEKYFQEVKIQSKNVSSKELEALLNLDFKKLGEFQYIEDRKTESVFIQINEEAKNVWNKYENIFSNNNSSLFEKKEFFAEIKSKFYDFVINIPIPYNEQTINFDSEKIFNFYLSNLEQPSIFYNYSPDNFRENTGYNDKSSAFF